MKKVSYSLLCGIAAIIVTIVLYFIILGNIFLQATLFFAGRLAGRISLRGVRPFLETV
jgi:hypothetical protein